MSDSHISVPCVPWCRVCAMVECVCSPLPDRCDRCGVDTDDPCGAEFIDPSMRCLLDERC